MQTTIGSPPAVWIMRDDGRERVPLIPGFGSSNPQWQRDGKRLLVTRGTGEGQWEFVWVDIASRKMTPTGLLQENMQNPRLSPDARELAYHRIDPDGKMSVWVAGFDGTRKLIAADPEAVAYPAWSPDGQWLGVEIKRGDSTHIGIVPRAGGPVEQLTSVRGQSWLHAWAPDGDRIVFAGQRDGVWNVYTVSRRTRAVTQVTSFTTGTGYVRSPTWSSAGSRVVFERGIESGSVWTMTLPRVTSP